jgi:hypothetical protein
VEPSLAIQVFLEALRSAASGDLERTRRLLERAVRLYGEQNGARIVHALLTYLFHVTPLAPFTGPNNPSRKFSCDLNDEL